MLLISLGLSVGSSLLTPKPKLPAGTSTYTNAQAPVGFAGTSTAPTPKFDFMSLIEPISNIIMGIDAKGKAEKQARLEASISREVESTGSLGNFFLSFLNPSDPRTAEIQSQYIADASDTSESFSKLRGERQGAISTEAGSVLVSQALAGQAVLPDVSYIKASMNDQDPRGFAENLYSATILSSLRNEAVKASGKSETELFGDIDQKGPGTTAQRQEAYLRAIDIMGLETGSPGGVQTAVSTDSGGARIVEDLRSLLSGAGSTAPQNTPVSSVQTLSGPNTALILGGAVLSGIVVLALTRRK